MSDAAAASALPASRLVPLRGAARARHAMPAHGRWVTALGWQPIAYSEMHLCAHYYPLAIRFSRGLPLLGVILDEAYLTRPLVDASGTWQGGYMPMAVRTFPFQATGNSVDPFDDLVVPADTDFLSAEAGTPLCRDDGAPSSHLQTLHRLARQLLDSRRSLAAALDHLLIARLLVPLRQPPNGTAQPATPQLHTVDRARFAEIEPAAFAAMARHRFASVDIAVACQFSLHRLRSECQPKSARSTLAASAAGGRGLDFLGMEDIAIDDGDLFSLGDLEATHSGLDASGSDAPEYPPV
ncbi:SapC family protein [Blastochloris sulfoviridis]|uniref:SapC family protein n=1 Tax=Blastochloris sulfoviridis TaxID=50712 RepID=A0A5M6HUD0_9HYPH|nr:SapC family protein [Blastochloris sulfoviridis]KAA5599534.1 SapC family protein [Blastochloris sulfoviridis]